MRLLKTAIVFALLNIVVFALAHIVFFLPPVALNLETLRPLVSYHLVKLSLASMVGAFVGYKIVCWLWLVVQAA